MRGDPQPASRTRRRREASGDDGNERGVEDTAGSHGKKRERRRQRATEEEETDPGQTSRERGHRGEEITGERLKHSRIEQRRYH